MCSHSVACSYSVRASSSLRQTASVTCRFCGLPGSAKSSRERGRAEALGGTSVLPTGQPEIQSHPGAAFPGLLSQSRRDAEQVRTS